MRVLYYIGVRLYVLAIIIVAPFNAKARLWISGRKGWPKKYQQLISNSKGKPVIWFHCASLGEFEMARPIIEVLRQNHKNDVFILISFFSPSGYEIQKNYSIADAVVYIPIDTPRNARKFIQIFKPSMAVFVKYEIWINYFNELKKNNAEIILINAVFRSNQRFFKWYGGIFRKALFQIDKVFVQNAFSEGLLQSIGIKSQISGDTRFDRALQIREQPKQIDDIKNWVDGKFCIVCGSSWAPEEKIIAKIFDKINDDVKWIIAPHNVAKGHINEIVNLFGTNQVLLSELSEKSRNKTVLILDSIGKLSQTYSLANIAIIGGGFSGKLHNIIEPGVYEIPILFGPYYSRFKEAIDMVEEKSAISFYDENDIVLYIEWYLYDHLMIDNVKINQHKLFEKSKGAVYMINGYIESSIQQLKK